MSEKKFGKLVLSFTCDSQSQTILRMRSQQRTWFLFEYHRNATCYNLEVTDLTKVTYLTSHFPKKLYNAGQNFVVHQRTGVRYR